MKGTFLLPCVVILLLNGLGTSSFVMAQEAEHYGVVLKDLNGFFPFEVPKSIEQWEERKKLLQRRVLVANNLWPMPKKTPLNAVIHGKIERPGFTVEKVYFESIPGFRVTGLLFRPVDIDPNVRLPAVLSPHGHGGRLKGTGAEKILEQIANGEEVFEDSGRFPKIARCATLARMGCVTLLYDMIGYADNQQLSFELAHRYATARPEFEGKEHWGFFSAQAEMRMQSIFGLQTWNSIRALDFLMSLPEVDPRRIGITGNSGGGTQTIILDAIDERPVVSFPNGMVSSSMQGGCTCENVCLLRIGTGNVELAAMFAPKPQGMTAADDWTKEMLVEGKGFSELQELYRMYGHPEAVICEDLRHFPHNYNYVTRSIMYSWFNKYLELGLEEPIVEHDFRSLTLDEQAVYDKDHPRPKGGDDFERGLTQWLADQSDRQLRDLPAEDRHSIVLLAWQTILGVDEISDREDDSLSLFIGAQYAKDKIAIWIDGDGKGAVVNAAMAKKIVDEGSAILTTDLLLSGVSETPVVADDRAYAGYTFGYNHTLFVQRVQQVVRLINRASRMGGAIQLIASNGAEPVAIASCAVTRKGVIQNLLLEQAQFRFVDITNYRDPDFVPGAVKYGDIDGLLQLVANNGTTVTLFD